MRCITGRECIIEKGDPKEFDSGTREWIQVLLGFFETFYEIPLHLHFTEDRDYFNRTTVRKQKLVVTDWAGADTTTGLIYLNPIKHMTSTKTQLLNSVLHECLHMKHPNATEKHVRKLADLLVRIRD
jgi:hypothetical protein